MSSGSFLAIMAGRGALIKPWIFQEVKEGRELCLTAQDRVGVYRQLVSHMKDHFGDDAMGWRKASYFLPWHFDFFCRYRCVCGITNVLWEILLALTCQDWLFTFETCSAVCLHCSPASRAAFRARDE